MLEIKIPDSEFFDDETNEFFTVNGGTLLLEHSLLSISNGNQNFVSRLLLMESIHTMK